MVNIDKTETNVVALTLSENETTPAGDYYWHLTNEQTKVLYSDIPLRDISNNTGRYNEFLVNISTIKNSYTFSEDVTITDEVWFFTGTVTINTGITVTIAANAAFVYDDNAIIINNGTLVVTGETYTDDLTVSAWCSYENLTNIDAATFIFVDLLGFYTYTATTQDLGATSLEFGKVYVKGADLTTITAIEEDITDIVAKRK